MTFSFSPPKIVQRYQYKNCIQQNDPITNKRTYKTPDGDVVPSTTTILSSTKDLTHLNEWKARVGADKAQQITTEAAGRGSSMHKNLENFINGIPRKPGNNLVHNIANQMANVIISLGLSKVNEVWGMEQSLYFPGLYSGTTDLVGVHDNIPSIMDYKQSNKPKKAEWVEDYMLQLVSYAEAHNEVYGTNIRKGVIFMAVKPTQNMYGVLESPLYQEFQLTPDNYNKYQDMWYARVEQYYQL